MARHHEYLTHRTAQASGILTMWSFRCFWRTPSWISNERMFSDACGISYWRCFHKGNLCWITHVYGPTHDTNDTGRPVPPWTSSMARCFPTSTVSTVWMALAPCRYSSSTLWSSYGTGRHDATNLATRTTVAPRWNESMARSPTRSSCIYGRARRHGRLQSTYGGLRLHGPTNFKD